LHSLLVSQRGTIILERYFMAAARRRRPMSSRSRRA
jgi:hypothetical protein